MGGKTSPPAAPGGCGWGRAGRASWLRSRGIDDAVEVAPSTRDTRDTRDPDAPLWIRPTQIADGSHGPDEVGSRRESIANRRGVDTPLALDRSQDQDDGAISHGG